MIFRLPLAGVALASLLAIPAALKESGDPEPRTGYYSLSKDDLRGILRGISSRKGMAKWQISEMERVIQCESSWRVDAHNRRDPRGGSRGIAQFQQRTFDFYSRRAGIDDPDIWNPVHQMHAMIYMWKLGPRGKSHWSCYRKIRDAG